MRYLASRQLLLTLSALAVLALCGCHKTPEDAATPAGAAAGNTAGPAAPPSGQPTQAVQPGQPTQPGQPGQPAALTPMQAGILRSNQQAIEDDKRLK